MLGREVKKEVKKKESMFTPKTSLTRSQRNVLDAIIFLIRKGEIPTVREVGAIAGLRSPATVFKHLRELEKAKLISTSGKSRGIRLADEDLLRQVLDRTPASKSGEIPGIPAIMQTHFPRVARLRPPALDVSAAGASAGLIPLVGAIAAGRPFESFAEGFAEEWFRQEFSQDLSQEVSENAGSQRGLHINPRLFAASGDLIALRVEGDSMIQAGILDGDYVIIRRQNTVEEGEIAAVLINGEGTLKRWRTRSGGRAVSLVPANERFDPIDIAEEDGKDVLVFGKYVGLVRGELQIF
jgi:repressor LexA